MLMKRLLLAVAVLALLIPASRQAEARTDVSIDFFYDNLNDGGSWVEVADYGYCWQPTVAVSNRNWRPYSDGYWAYTDVGWAWVSYEDFGWATYHYGRWMRLRGRGWVWMPGRDWGPAWVSWRTGGDYVGWAPLPPRRSGVDIYAEFSPINSRVDIDFDIGPAYYNFIDVRYIGEPVLRERIYASERNVTYMTQTVNVTNITYANSTVYNYGPDYNTVSRYSTRPIQRLSLQRETNVDAATAAQAKSFMKVQGDKLVVAAPQQFQKPVKTVAPKVVKEKIAQTPLERGWEPVADKKAQADLRAKMQKEDPKSVPPPTIKGSEKTEASPAATAPGSTPITATTTPATSASPATSAPASPTTSAPPAPTTSASTSAPKDKKARNKSDNVLPAPNASAAVTPRATPENSRDKRNEKPAPSAPPKPQKEKQEKRSLESIAPQAAPMENSVPRFTPPPVKKPESVEKSKPSAESAPKMKNEPSQERMAPPPTNVPVNPPRKSEDKKQKKNEAAPSPSS
jgi:hypothetical protein